LLPRWFLPWSQWQVAHSSKVAHHNHAMPPALRPLVTGVRRYHRKSAPLLLPVFEGLRDGQQPSALFLTCADSRVVPNVLTSSGPGDLFTVRNIGNLVPPPSSADRSVLACMHYAIEHLAVSTVLICGHSSCGAMKGLLAGVVDGDDPVGQWLRWGMPSLHALSAGHPVGEQAQSDGWGDVDRLAMVNVAQQVDVVSNLPVARDVIEQQKLRVAGLFFDIVSARLLMLDTAQQRFVPLPGAEGLTQPQLSDQG
jgi:carbonic anhydrase